MINDEELLSYTNNLEIERDVLVYVLTQMVDYYIHEKELEDDELERLNERAIALITNPNAI